MNDSIELFKGNLLPMWTSFKKKGGGGGGSKYFFSDRTSRQHTLNLPTGLLYDSMLGESKANWQKREEEQSGNKQISSIPKQR